MKKRKDGSLSEDSQLSTPSHLMRVQHERSFFGERGLLHDELRSATVTAVGQVKCVTLTKKDFHGLLGSLTKQLETHMQQEHMENRMSGHFDSSPALAPMEYQRQTTSFQVCHMCQTNEMLLFGTSS